MANTDIEDFDDKYQDLKILNKNDMVKITEKILTYIIHANRHIGHFEIIPKLNSEWNVDKITYTMESK